MSDVGERNSGVLYPMSDVEEENSDVLYPMLDVLYPMSDVGDRNLVVLYPMSDVLDKNTGGGTGLKKTADPEGPAGVTDLKKGRGDQSVDPLSFFFGFCSYRTRRSS